MDRQVGLLLRSMLALCLRRCSRFYLGPHSAAEGLSPGHVLPDQKPKTSDARQIKSRGPAMLTCGGKTL